MKKSSGPCQTASQLSEPVRRHIHRLAVATILVGVGLLALAWPAEAEIVYTPVNVTIAPNEKYSLDLNHDGIKDFTIPSNYWEISSQISCVQSQGVVHETPASGNGAESNPPAELTAGDQIGPSQTFSGSLGIMVSSNYFSCRGTLTTSGNWQFKGESGYLGLMFQIDGETHYGWAELSITSVGVKGGLEFVATLTGYAYETIAGTPINAGQTTEADDSSALRPGPVQRDGSGLGSSVTNPMQAVSLCTFALGTQQAPLVAEEGIRWGKTRKQLAITGWFGTGSRRTCNLTPHRC